MNTNQKRKPGRPPRQSATMDNEIKKLVEPEAETLYSLAEAIFYIQEGKVKSFCDEQGFMIKVRSERDSQISVFDKNNIYKGNTFSFAGSAVKKWRVYKF